MIWGLIFNIDYAIMLSWLGETFNIKVKGTLIRKFRECVYQAFLGLLLRGGFVDV